MIRDDLLKHRPVIACIIEFSINSQQRFCRAEWPIRCDMSNYLDGNCVQPNHLVSLLGLGLGRHGGRYLTEEQKRSFYGNKVEYVKSTGKVRDQIGGLWFKMEDWLLARGRPVCSR
jgi:hypothetical protein